jgi:PAS domain S-box-containing protein
MEDGLKSAEDKYRALFDSCPAPILLLEKGAIADCNSAAVEFFRFKTRPELLSRKMSALSARKQSQAELEAHMKAAYARGSDGFMWLFKRADGSSFEAKLQLKRVDFGGKPVLHALIT